MFSPEIAATGPQNKTTVPEYFGASSAFVQSERPGFVFLDRPVSSFGLSLRASNALTRAGISTAGDAVQWTVRDLRTLPGFGPASAAALQSVLAALGLRLREPEIIFGR